MTKRLGTRQLANRVQWVRDLGSGGFTQAKGSLKKDLMYYEDDPAEYGYCCLGVACERIAPRSPQLKLDPIGGESESLMTPSFAQTHLGIDDNDQEQAAIWNDEDRYDFKRIADLIAWATEHKIGFLEADSDDVPNGYRLAWLEQFD